MIKEQTTQPEHSSVNQVHNTLLLSYADNVVIVVSTLNRADRVSINAKIYLIDRSASTGFKIARRFIESGETIFKYGAPIGTATKDITPGAVVHTHNMKSDYLPTYTPGHVGYLEKSKI